MQHLTPKAWFGLAATLLLGGIVLWFQIGLLAGTIAMATGANGFRGSLGAAAEQLGSGDFDVAQQDFVQAENAATAMAWSAALPQLDAVARIPGAQTAIANWQTLAGATTAVTDGTAELLSLYGDLSGKNGGTKIFSNGRIDLDLLRALPPRVATTDDNIDTSITLLDSIDTTGPGAGLLEEATSSARRQVRPVQEAVAALRDLAPLLPDALGANGTKRYLIAIGNQAEMRASGGAPLSLVMVEFDDGQISIPIKGTTSTELFPPVNRPVSWWGPALNPFFAENPRDAPFVVANTHPSLLFSAREMAGAWRAGDFPLVDGVITIDLTAIAAVLNATGPIQSPVYGEVTGDQLGQLLLIDAYQEFGQEEADIRQAANQELLDALLSRILSGDDLVTSARAIASTAPGRHFQVWTRNAGIEELARASGASGDVLYPGRGDWSAAYTQNGNQSKVDVFQQRNVIINAQVAEDGSARVTQQMTVTNATPVERPEGPPERVGYETSWVKNAYLMYVPDPATNYRVSYPEEFAVRPFRNHEQLGGGFVNDGDGQKLVRVVGWTPPGGQSSVYVSYELPPGTFLPSAGSPTIQANRLVYNLRAEPQSLWTPSTLTVRVTGPLGWQPVDVEGALITGNSIEVSAVQNAPVALRLAFSRILS